MLAGGAAYLVGNIVVTIIGNVPLNGALDAVDPDSAEGEALWRQYLTRWTSLNHVRTVTAVLAAGLLMAAL